MTTEDTENDHDYAAIRLRNLIVENENLHLRQVLRIVRNSTGYQIDDTGQSTSRNPENLHNNYLLGSDAMSGSNASVNVSDGTTDDDHDVFEDESGDIILNSSSTTMTYETDTRSEDSISTTTSSSYQTHSSEQLTDRSSDSLASTSELSERALLEPTNESHDNHAVASSSTPAVQQIDNANNHAEVITLNSPSPPKKRKRLSLENDGGTPKVKEKNATDLNDEDEGLTCPICLDNWEMNGEHRLASLKCGHLFGNSCIRRWLQESYRQSGQKVCPQCKTKAHPKEIRYLYAKRLRAIDRSEEHRMRDQLTEAQSKTQSLSLELATLKMSYAQVTQKLKALESDNNTLNTLLQNGGGYPSMKSVEPKRTVLYKLFMDRNIEISKEPGCRVMQYAEHQNSLIVSQKSTQNLFPGYGLRFVDNASFKPTNFLHTSLKLLRDISLSDDQQLLAAASMETKVKLFDLRILSAYATFKPAEKPIWSCSLGRRDSEFSIYLGSQNGSIYVYDTRFPETIVNDYQAECDLSPVVQIASVPACSLFPGGGFLVCKLTSIWFYEQSGATANPTRLSIEGRFISMDFNAVQLKLLVQTRSCARYPRARYILGKLNKINEIPVFEINVTFFASTNSPVMARCTQIGIESNTLVAAYIQDSKLLSIYDANREQCIQSLLAQDIVYDSCPIYTKDYTYLAALTETKCRLYKINSN